MAIPYQEAALNDFTLMIQPIRHEYYGVRFFLSKLHNIRFHEFHRRVVGWLAQEYAEKHAGKAFIVQHSDLVLVLKKSGYQACLELEQQLIALFEQDPYIQSLIQKRSLVASSEENALVEFYDLGQDFTKFQAFVHHLASILRHPKLFQLSPSHQTELVEDRRKSPRFPLEAKNFSRAQQAILQADPRSVIRQQAIFHCPPDQNEAVPVFYETYIHIRELQKQNLSSIELLSNMNLFHALGPSLDQKLLEGLDVGDHLKKPFSANLTLETLLSEQFYKFHQRHERDRRFLTHIECQYHDSLYELGLFRFACKWLQNQGYQLCLDGISFINLPWTDEILEPCSWIKILWNPDFFNQARAKQGLELKQRLEKIGLHRIILCRCDSKDAIDTGKSLGICYFQGTEADRMFSTDQS